MGENEEEIVENVFLVGNGAVVNGWKPVCAAIEEFWKEEKISVADDPDAANFWFARIVQLWRFTALHARLRGRDLVSERSRRPAAHRELKRLVSENREFERIFKRSLAAHILSATASGELTLREEFVRVTLDPRWRGPTIYVTTNWDLLLERAISAGGKDPSKVWHLHGRVDHPEDMLLPSELPEEPYRGREQCRRMARQQRQPHIFNRARRIVIYGLSLSPLDASLAQVIGSGLDTPASGEPREIFIMNCGRDQLARVAKRFQLLTRPHWPWKIHMVDMCSPEGMPSAGT